MSAFAVRGLVKGGWPLVVEFEQDQPGVVQLKIAAKGVETFTYKLPSDKVGRHQIVLRLPSELGSVPVPAVVATFATRDSRGRATLPGFRLLALGAGPDAVGSVVVEPVRFDPPNISVSRHQRALYAFHSLSDFDNANVEFLRVTDAPDGSQHRVVRESPVAGGIRKNQWIRDQEWDGRDRIRHVSTGPHKLQVRVWDRDGDWEFAWSDSLVSVRQ